MIEAIRNPQRFLALAARATRRGKPVIAIKLGRSQAARMAALAHTGALAGSDDAVNALFERAGVIRAGTIDEAIDQCALICLVPQEHWLKGSARLGVFTVGGGLAGLISDLAQDRGIAVPALPESIREIARAHVPVNVNVQNPFDVAGPYITEKPQLAYDFVRACLAGDVYDAVVMLRSMPGPKNLEYLDPLNDLPGEFGKPVFVAAPIDSGMEDFKRAFMARSRLTLVTGLNRLMTGLDAMLHFGKAHAALQGTPEAAPAVPAFSAATAAAVKAQAAAGRKLLGHEATYALLEELGLPVVPQRLVASAAEAVAFADRTGYPVVVKLANSEAATHKTELGAIHVGMADAAAVAKATEHLLRLVAERGLSEDGKPVPVLVQKMVAPALKLFLGATVPAGGYPPLVLVGAGGIFVEVLRDVVCGVAPLTHDEALATLKSLKTWPLLNRYRGGPQYDVDAVARCLVALGDLIAASAESVGKIDAIDLNPLLVCPQGQGALIVDAVVTLAQPAAQEAELAMGSFEIIDTHAHYWQPASAERPWAPGANAPAPEPLSVEDILATARAAGVDRVVQVVPSLMGWDNRYAFEGAAAHPDAVAGVVARVDPLAPDLDAQLAALVAEPKLLGIRIALLRPTQLAWFNDDTLAPVFMAAARYGFPIALFANGHPRPIAALARRFPDTRIIVDHMALYHKKADPFDEWADVRLSNTWMNVSYLPEVAMHAEAWPYPRAQRRVRELADTFGAARLMFGTNYPPSRHACSYAQSVDFMREAASFLPEAGQAELFGKTFLSLYPMLNSGGLT